MPVADGMAYLTAATPASASRLIVTTVLGGMNLGDLRQYTRRALLPEFSEQLGYNLRINLGLLAQHEHFLLPGFAQVWESPEPSTRLTLDLSSGYVLASPFQSDLELDWFGVAQTGVGIDRALFAPGLSRDFNGGSLDVAAVFATQRYASWGLGEQITRYVAPSTIAEESSAGTGLRLAFNSELAPGVSVDAGFQSRIDMDAFQQFRGVYSEPGDFDIPASANFGLVFNSGGKSSISVQIQRVLYSDINPFTTAALPDRFLSLLGDGGSPDFTWRDLTIYRVGWNWRQGELWDWQVQYSTRQQPEPTSELLSRALESEVADSNLSVGFSRRAWDNARVHFAASYAPSDYYLGPALFGRASEEADNDLLEFEVKLIWDF